ncbi:MAG: RND transporter, partial [Bdellovibrionota bacterium]
ATLFAFLAVVLLVFLLFRDFRISFQVLFALGLGVLWLSGMIFGFRLKINFLNFIALPITFGIGVDYGVNIFQRYRTDQSGDIISIIRQTGGAVGLCSLTTIIGYTSLLIAGNQGFVSFGTLAVAGELSCVTAAVVALPAWLAWRDRRNRAKLLRLPARAVPALIKKDTRPAA